MNDVFSLTEIVPSVEVDGILKRLQVSRASPGRDPRKTEYGHCLNESPEWRYHASELFCSERHGIKSYRGQRFLPWRQLAGVPTNRYAFRSLQHGLNGYDVVMCRSSEIVGAFGDQFARILMKIWICREHLEETETCRIHQSKPIIKSSKTCFSV